MTNALSSARIPTVWKPTRLRDVLIDNDRSERVQGHVEYRLLGVRLAGRGPFLRAEKLGQEIQATYLSRVHAGDFIYSRLFAWRGAFGVVPPEFDGAHVSGEFPTFTVDKTRLDANFLRFYFSRPQIWAVVEGFCAGTTKASRNRFKERFFLEMEVALPSLDEQRRIVSRLEKLAAKIQEARRLRHLIAEETKALVPAALEDILLRYRDAIRRFPLSSLVRLERRPVTVELEKEYVEIGIYSYGRGIFHKAPRTGSQLGDKKLFWVKDSDLILQITFAWEGAVALASPSEEGLCGSVRFPTFRVDETLCAPRYLLEYLKTREGIDQLGKISPGSAGRNRVLSPDRLSEVTVPVPPLAIQKQLMDSVQGRVEELTRLQNQTAVELDALMPSILAKAFRGEL